MPSDWLIGRRHLALTVRFGTFRYWGFHRYGEPDVWNVEWGLSLSLRVVQFSIEIQV